MRFFDSHCHFDFPEFDAERNSLWQEAVALGVHSLVMPGVYPLQWERLLSMSLATERIYFALGIHPCWIYTLDVSAQALVNYELQIRQLLSGLPVNQQHKFVAVGECGLDNTIAVPLSLQQEVLAWHIELANSLRKPVILHSVKTHNELIRLCKKHKPRYGGIVHAFSGSYETAMQLIDLGFYLGVGGTITYERAQKTRATVARIPAECMVLETDGPDMPLCGQQGQRNDPQNVVRIAQLLAGLRSVSLESLVDQLWENTCRVFQLVDGYC